MTRAVAAHGQDAHFYCSSGGNAGLACATAAAALGRPATIVLPTSAPEVMKRKLLAVGAMVHVQVHGAVWAEADRFLREELVANDPTGIYVPPFDHQDIWDGASTIVEELREQLAGQPIHAILASVGGGGLVNGLVQGVESSSWNSNNHDNDSNASKPVVIAVETEGADSLNASIRAGSHITLPAITSIAKSLGATRVSERTWRWSQSCPDTLRSVVVSDADAAISCVRFADDARLLVEVSCGAAIAPVYRGDLRDMLGKGLSDDEWAERNVVVEVCGGAAVALETLAAYREEYGPLATIKAS